jgi:hypothetical protein
MKCGIERNQVGIKFFALLGFVASVRTWSLFIGANLIL